MRASGRVVVCGTPLGAVWYALVGVMLEKMNFTLLTAASSAIDIRLFWMSSFVIGPVLPAMSLVPARMMTAFGLRASTSGLNRISICGVVWALMPRPAYFFPGKNAPNRGCGHESVIESP